MEISFDYESDLNIFRKKTRTSIVKRKIIKIDNTFLPFGAA